MVLYEDLRIYTIWRTDVAECKQQALDYKKSAEEWEILGDLAQRLHHPAEAVEAYQACLRIRFSPKAMRGVLKMLESEGQYKDVLAALIRLIAWQYRWYSEVRSPFSAVTAPIAVHSTLTWITVLPRSSVYHPQAHRGGRRGQGPQYRAGHERAATGAGPDASLCSVMCRFPK